MVDTKGAAETTNKRRLFAAAELAGFGSLPCSKTQRVPFEAAVSGNSFFTWPGPVPSKRALIGQYQ